MQISTSTVDDIPEIFELYDAASALQRQKFPENIWPKFDADLIKTEVEEKRQFKLLIDGQIACIWAITYSDLQIWGSLDQNNSIFIHRITTNPAFRGNNYISVIVDWAKKFARQQNKSFIRMDTCGYNKKLIEHYTKAGFDFLGVEQLDDTHGLPGHYQVADVCFFEINLK